MTEGVKERIDKGVLLWFVHLERVGNDRTVKRDYEGECAGICSVGRL